MRVAPRQRLTPVNSSQAGIVTVAPLLDTDLKAVHNILQVNTISQLEMVQAFAKLLVNTANDPSLGGRETLVLNVGSSAADGSPWHAVYGFSKVGNQGSRGSFT